MIRLGLTGGCCTGKSTVAQMFSRLGAEVVSADGIVHRLLREDQDVKSGVLSIFGEAVLANDGAIDREKLADIVFHDKESLTRLTDLLYPKVKRDIRRVFEEMEGKGTQEICVAEVPLLIEEGALDLYDAVLVVKANYSNQLRRFLQRGGKSQADLGRRIANQMDLTEKVRLADYVIDNDGSLDQTFEQVKNIYQNIRLRPRQRRGASSTLAAGDVRSKANKGKIKSER